ncbi:hypothetical protein PCLA_21f0031 [Pseudomonas citronellolis]|nr:hypothetical protein PCLA_21f0031 [Pseudomonas citronellolis]
MESHGRWLRLVVVIFAIPSCRVPDTSIAPRHEWAANAHRHGPAPRYRDRRCLASPHAIGQGSVPPSNLRSSRAAPEPRRPTTGDPLPGAES